MYNAVEEAKAQVKEIIMARSQARRRGKAPRRAAAAFSGDYPG